MKRAVLIAVVLVLFGVAAWATPDGPRYYYLGPWQWDAVESAWEAPAGTVGLVDLSPTARKEDINGGLGFFSSDVPLDPSMYYAYFGTDLNAVMDQDAIDRWAAETGTNPQAGSYTLLDLFWDSLTIWADPDGATFCPPLTPTHLGQLELHLGGHSLIRSRAWKGVDDPSWPKVKAMLRRSYRELREQIASDIAKINTLTLADLQARGSDDPQLDRVIKAARKLVQGGMTPVQARTQIIQEVTDHEVTHAKRVLGARMADFRIADWRELVPDDLQDWEPLPPETTYTDGFTDSDSTALTAHTPDDGGGGSWTRLFGTTPTISSNQLVGVNNTHVRRESDVSSANHYCALTMVSGDRHSGPTCRFDSTSWTFYTARNASFASPNEYTLRKIISGSESTLISNTAGTDNGVPTRITVQSNGTTISMYDSGGLIDSIVDTSIATYTRGGIATRSSGSYAVLDAWEFADLAPAGPSIPVVMYHRQQQAWGPTDQRVAVIPVVFFGQGEGYVWVR